MVEETKSNSTAAEDYLNDIIGVMKQNEAFLQQNAEETYYEVVELINDAIDNIMPAVKKSVEDYVKYSMISFIHHILMPFSYAIYMDMLAGNIPACFMELRLMLESLVKCYLADLQYQDQSCFQDKLKLLEEERKSTSELMMELGEKLGSNFVALWGKLSQDWVHTKGIMDRVVAQVIEKTDVPSWGLVLPMYYAESDLDTIDELRNRISKFRSLLTAVMEKYQQENN
ncbi:MAG: hypothetical protein ACYSYV_03550 [Planctomycetota bacterium]|jgi:hypothetical protein